MRIQVFDGASCFEDLAPAWNDLLSSVPTATPFQSREWHQTWFDHYGRSKQPYLVAAYEGNDLVGLFPLARKRGLWSILRSSGAGPSDYLQPLILPGYESGFERLLSEHLTDQSRAGLIDLHQLREDLSEMKLPDEISIEQGTCLVLNLPKSYDDYLATLGKSLRYDVRKLEKSLFKEGRASVMVVEEDRIGEGLDILFDQHKKRWRKRGLPGAFIGRAQAFHHDWGRKAIARGWLGLGILKFEDHPIGAIYTMSMGPSTFFYQAGFDPAHKTISPGTLLVASMIKRAIEEGRDHFDFLRGDEPYKRRWKPQREHKNYRRISAVGGPTGQLGARWNLLGSRIESKIRERLEGKGLL
jgi:CelD/BcsL family acetyltransferase involved in cellulose biosynthesis